MYSKRIQRQLNKSFGENFNPEGLWEKFPEFLRQVDLTYSQLEEKANLAARTLDISSQELTENNSNLFSLNQNFAALLNSLDQGFLMFDRNGKCLPIHSRVCIDLLECNPENRNIAEVLKIPEGKVKGFLGWVDLLFGERSSFEDLVEIGPKTFPHSMNRSIEIAFKPVRSRDGLIENIVLIATDTTETQIAKSEAAKMFEYANLISRVMREKSQFSGFLKFAEEIIQELDFVSSSTEFKIEDLIKVKHLLHTFKGTASSFGFSRVSELIHSVETRLISQSDLQSSQKYLRESVHEVSESYHETISIHGDLFQGILSSTDTIREVSLSQLKDFSFELSDRGLNDLANRFSHLFIGVSAQQVFRRFESDLRDCCLKAGKPVPVFQISSEEVNLVPEELESILNQLIHVFRNIATHGLETAAERRRIGKAMTPKVFIDVKLIQNSNPRLLRISISDDGKGLDLNSIRQKLEKIGRGAEVNNMSISQMQSCIFDEGFSTAIQVSELAGRGVGLSSLKCVVEEQGGTIQVVSEWGIGTQFVITVPVVGLSTFGKAETQAA